MTGTGFALGGLLRGRPGARLAARGSLVFLVFCGTGRLTSADELVPSSTCLSLTFLGLPFLTGVGVGGTGLELELASLSGVDFFLGEAQERERDFRFKRLRDELGSSYSEPSSSSSSSSSSVSTSILVSSDSDSGSGSFQPSPTTLGGGPITILGLQRKHTHTPKVSKRCIRKEEPSTHSTVG